MPETEPREERLAFTPDGKPIVYIVMEDSGVRVYSPFLDLDFALPKPCYRADNVKTSIELRAGQSLLFIEENHSRNHK